MADSVAMEQLDRAQKAIRQALAQWDPTSLDRVEDSRELLELAVADMRAFEIAVRSGMVNITEELVARILTVKQEIVHAARIVDVCVAFHRGLATQLGQTTPGL